METMLSMQTALIALVGTLLVALLAFYQWRKRSQLDNASSIALSRKQAIERLWQKSEQISMDLRNSDDPVDSINDRIKELNELFLLESLYLHDDEQSLFADYIRALARLKRAIHASGDAEALNAFQQTGAAIGASGEAEINMASSMVAGLRESIRKLITTT
jgi:hypothetical protein